jgi:hypothetical protein
MLHHALRAARPRGGLTYVGDTFANGSSVSIPAGHRAGDLLLIMSNRNGWNSGWTPFSSPSDWTTVLSGSTLQYVFRAAWKLAASGAETSGEWTGAEKLACFCWRGAAPASPVGASSSMVRAGSNLILPALTGSLPGGWIAACAVAANGTPFTSGGAPSTIAGMELRLGASSYLRAWDSGEPRASFPETTLTAGSAQYASVTLEIKPK